MLRLMLEAGARLPYIIPPTTRRHQNFHGFPYGHGKSGLRVGEVCALLWRSVDTAHQWLVIEHAKGAAGVREVDLSLDLVEELKVWRAGRTPASVDEFVFATASGGLRDKDSVRERSLRRSSTAPTRSRLSAARTAAEDHAARPAPHVHQAHARGPERHSRTSCTRVGHAHSETTLEIYA